MTEARSGRRKGPSAHWLLSKGFLGCFSGFSITWAPALLRFSCGDGLKEKSRQLSKIPSSKDKGAPGHTSCSAFFTGDIPPSTLLCISNHLWPGQASDALGQGPHLRNKEERLSGSRLGSACSDIGQVTGAPASATGTNALHPSTEGTQTHWGFSRTTTSRDKPSCSNTARFLTGWGSPLQSSLKSLSRRLPGKANSHSQELMGFLCGRGQRGTGVREPSRSQTIAPPALTCG